MGIRFRKSIRVGKHFKINLSKSGIGYSLGVKGAHISKTATGSIRRTLSIPGTGLSHVSESKSAFSSPQNVDATPNDIEIKHDGATDMVSFNEVTTANLSDIARSILIRKITYLSFLVLLAASFIGLLISFIFITDVPDFLPFIFMAALLVFAVATIVARATGKVHLEYSLDEENGYDNSRQNLFMEISKSNKIWLVLQAGESGDSRTNYSAQAHISRAECSIGHRPVFPIKTNADVVCFKCKKNKETLVFLPDQLIVFKGFKVNSFEYSDLHIETGETQFVESEHVPKDATVLNYVWQKSNNNGTIDRRYKNNSQLPLCQYGGVGIEKPNELELFIMVSNFNLIGKPTMTKDKMS